MRGPRQFICKSDPKILGYLDTVTRFEFGTGLKCEDDRRRDRVIVNYSLTVGWGYEVFDGRHLSVCPFVCPVPDRKSRMEGQSRLKIGRKTRVTRAP